jgi:cytochrome c peroxidase
MGHAVFHSNSGGGLACASCHPEGHEDGRVWDFACEHARRTQDLSGGLSTTAPFHWSGDLADFPQLMDTVFVGRMSGPRLGPDQMMAALKWIDAIPQMPPLRSPSDAQVQRGKTLFNSPTLGCVTCHAGNALTNNSTVDVGTSAPFQVPSLRGIGWRAPYMHNGCATTLTGRFTSKSCGGGDAHGKTSALMPAQIDDLVAFLESI